MSNNIQIPKMSDIYDKLLNISSMKKDGEYNFIAYHNFGDFASANKVYLTFNLVGLFSSLKEVALVTKKQGGDTMNLNDLIRFSTGIDGGEFDKSVGTFILSNLLNGFIKAGKIGKDGNFKIDDFLGFNNEKIKELSYYFAIFDKNSKGGYIPSVIKGVKNKISKTKEELSLDKVIKNNMGNLVTFYDTPFLGPINNKYFDSHTQKFIIGAKSEIILNDDMKNVIKKLGNEDKIKNMVEIWSTVYQGKILYFYIDVRNKEDAINELYVSDRDIQKDTLIKYLLKNEINQKFINASEIASIIKNITTIGKARALGSIENKIKMTKAELNFEINPITEEKALELLSVRGTSGNPQLIDEYIYHRISEKYLEEIKDVLVGKYVATTKVDEAVFESGKYKISWSKAKTDTLIGDLDENDSNRAEKIKELYKNLEFDLFYKVLGNVFSSPDYFSLRYNEKSDFAKELNSIFTYIDNPNGYYRTEEIYESLTETQKANIKTDYIKFEGLDSLKNIENKTPKEISELLFKIKDLIETIKTNSDILKEVLKIHFTGDIAFGTSKLRYESKGSNVINDEYMTKVANTPEFSAIADERDVQIWKTKAKEIIMKNILKKYFETLSNEDIAKIFTKTKITEIKKWASGKGEKEFLDIYNTYFAPIMKNIEVEKTIKVL